MTAFPAGIRAALRRFWTKREPEVFSFHQEGVLGTSFELRVRSCLWEAAEEAERRALAEIDRLERIFSVFDPTSEFRQWQAQRGREIRISPELMCVLQACDSWREKSAGAFNPATEIFTEVWREAVRENRRPSADELSFCAHQASQVLWSLNPANQTAVYLAQCPLNLNGIAKGYIVDRACEAALGEIGEREIIRGVTLSIGGDLRVHSDREETAGVSDPDNDAENAPLFACVRLREGALATSGDW
ncbi:MAG: FAD:protein FMN transferase, partial [Armatimonadota bacterium]